MTPFLAIFGGLGWPELLVIGLVVLLVFGPRRLPEIAESFGGGGHKHASGLYLEGKREEVARQVLAALPLGGLRSSSQG